VNGDAELDALVARFRVEDGYPTSEDQSDLRAREEFEAHLRELLEAESPDWRKLQFIISTAVYGNPGPQSILNDSINRLDKAGSRRLQETLRHLLDPDRPLAKRIDDTLNDAQKVRGPRPRRVRSGKAALDYATRHSAPGVPRRRTQGKGGPDDVARPAPRRAQVPLQGAIHRGHERPDPRALLRTLGRTRTG
jgi:hypothetical protein